ncbi:methylmalonyl Co-A mutase-associated GTPase MeaB [bacterium]|nr:methylmalonyl Co-A mutase-associated GTPase MeaB [bacterium]
MPSDAEQPMSQRELARLLSRLERSPEILQDTLAALPAAPGPVQRIGFTGSPGVGKSTLLHAVIRELRERGERVGVIAVDPTSPFSGGALLGDRLRLAPQQDDDGVFIRSIGSRGSLGGISPQASVIASVLESAGYTRILIETVGVGQTGYDVVSLADTVVALFSPEGGDGIQLIKAGILELGDIFVVNKADRPGADTLLKEIGYSLAMEPPPPTGGWQRPVLSMIASSGQGAAELVDAMESHGGWLGALPGDHPARQRRMQRELEFTLRSSVGALLDGELRGLLDSLASDVLKGDCGRWDAVARLKRALAGQLARD